MCSQTLQISEGSEQSSLCYYLNEKELRAMGQLVSGYLDFAERQAEREQVMSMSDVEQDYLNSIKILEKKTDKG